MGARSPYKTEGDEEEENAVSVVVSFFAGGEGGKKSATIENLFLRLASMWKTMALV